MEWIAEPGRKPGYTGGPTLKTLESQSLVVNYHTSPKDPKDVSSNYKANIFGTDNFPARLSGPCVKGNNVSLPRPKLSKNKLLKLRRYGKVPAELKLYCNSKGMLPEPILAQYL